MTQTIKTIVTSILFAAMLLVPVMMAGTAHAQNEIKNGLCQGANLQVGSSGGCTTGDPEGKVNSTIEWVINVFSIVVGVVAVIMIIIGGFKYITSSGDSNNVTSAKNTILYAIIGLVIVALAQFIVKFVLSKATSAGS